MGSHTGLQLRTRVESGTEGILGEELRLSPRRLGSSAGCHGAGVGWSECRWSRVNPTPHTIVNTTRQAKYMVRSVSWWTWTALASAWWSRPLLCPEVWLPSALGTGTETAGQLGQAPPPRLGRATPPRLGQLLTGSSQGPGLGLRLLPVGKQRPQPVSEATPAGTGGRRGEPLTCHVLYPPGGTWPGRPPGERSTLARGWTQSACSARRCDTAGR